MKITDFKILYDNVLVKGIEIKEKDGVLLASSYEDKPEFGEVVSVGEGRIFDTGEVVQLKVKKGDMVYFNKYSSTKLNVDGNDYFVVHEEDIVGYIR